MLEFQKQILTEIVSDDALLILSPGLGLFKLLCSFLQLHCKGKHLVLILNTTRDQDAAIQDRLAANGVTPENIMQIIEYDTPSDTRNAMYRQSGLFSVTSRILAVDMLLKRVPIAMISGIIVYNAHRVKPNSMEELILRIYREENQEGFIKAFSDQPNSFVTGFAPLQNTLKSLQLRKVLLWPRFQVVVSDNLAETDGEVVELRQPLTPMMEKIQQSLVECMEATLSHIRRANPTVDLQEFTIENSFFNSFDIIVRRQLDPVWHRVTLSTKQLVNDLRDIRDLLTYLSSYDCVSFYSFVETLIAFNTPSDGKWIRQSQWLMTEAADVAIKSARQRVFLKPGEPNYQTAEKTLLTSAPGSVGLPPDIKLVLENQPKWELLRDILREIEEDTASMNDGQGMPVLVMVNEQRTSKQLSEYVSMMHRADTSGKMDQPVLGRLARNFFRWKGTVALIQKSSTEVAPHQLPSASQSSVSGARGTAPPNKRRRVRGGSATAAAATMSSRPPHADTLRQGVIENTLLLDETRGESETEAHQIEPETITFGEHDILPEFEEIPANMLVTVRCYSTDLDEHLLEETKPRCIIMYDPDPTFVRRVEVYRATNPGLDVRVYFMIYENSVEEQNYLSLVRKEKEAFEKLIREKSIMAIPLAQQKKDTDDAFIRSISSRVAGGQLGPSVDPQVIVDMREFRSSLPPILYAQGMKILPCTLQVGDYILTPDMCVERKSIADLIQSFNSGRLYTQCESMCMHYEKPILLIEFDENKSFSLQSLSDMKESIVLSDLSSKLVLLTLSFTKLRIIWSSSPHETAAVFEELKKTYDEPDPDKAAMIGAETLDDSKNTYNMTPQNILRSMPGVTSKNYRTIIDTVENLESLCNLAEEEIQRMIGEAPGRKLYRFIHQQAAQHT